MPLLPVQEPAIAESFGVSLLTVIIYMFSKHAAAFGEAFENKQFDAYKRKGGSVLALCGAHYAFMLLHNYCLVLIFTSTIFFAGYILPDGLLVALMWAHVEPLFIMQYVFNFYNKTDKHASAQAITLFKTLA